MKCLPLTLAALALAAGGAAAQSPAARAQSVPGPCPTISVSCPVTASPGTPVTFTVNVSGGDSNVNPSFRWAASAGAIASGQGTSIITVDTTEMPSVMGQRLTATVEVGGYPPACRNTASCASDFNLVIDHFATDEYGDLRWADEKARLDNFAVDLRNNPFAHGYIICYGGRRGRRGEAAERCARARDYLVTRRKIPAGRLVTIDGGYREDLTVTLWPLPPGTRFTPSPTVDPSEVKFAGELKKRGARRKPR